MPTPRLGPAFRSSAEGLFGAASGSIRGVERARLVDLGDSGVARVEVAGIVLPATAATDEPIVAGAVVWIVRSRGRAVILGSVK
jgi:hypothetical protein